MLFFSPKYFFSPQFFWKQVNSVKITKIWAARDARNRTPSLR